MATNADVLNFATQKLVPKWTEQFYQHHPVLDKIVLKGNIERGTQGGPYLEFPVVTNGPGKVTRNETGSEVSSSVRRTGGTRGQIYAPRMVYSFIIPGKDLAEASGETAIARLIKVYPEAALMEFHEYIVEQLVNGNGSGNNVQGFLTLNGDTSFDASGTAEAGILDFTTPTLQTETVLNIAKQGTTGTTGWFNQYQNVSSFATDGRKQMRRVYWDASLQGKQGGPVDPMIGDILSFNNYYDDLDDQVRYNIKFDGERGKGVRQGLMFQEAEFYVEPGLDPTDTDVFTSRDGVIYFLKTDTWHLYTQGEDSGMETKGDFAFRGPVKVPGQDAWEWEIVLSMQMYCDRLNANGCIDGTSNA